MQQANSIFLSVVMVRSISDISFLSFISTTATLPVELPSFASICGAALVFHENTLGPDDMKDTLPVPVALATGSLESRDCFSSLLLFYTFHVLLVQ
jgi:hypothetical protein